MPTATENLIARYYAAFNARDWPGMLDCLADDVTHHVNEGAPRQGKVAFADFLGDMERSYDERLADIVVMSDGANRAAAEFTVHGRYLIAADGLPPARGQTYVLPAGAFFEVRAGKIERVTTYYNLNSWLAQVA